MNTRFLQSVVNEQSYPHTMSRYSKITTTNLSFLIQFIQEEGWAKGKQGFKKKKPQNTKACSTIKHFAQIRSVHRTACMASGFVSEKYKKHKTQTKSKKIKNKKDYRSIPTLTIINMELQV